MAEKETDGGESLAPRTAAASVVGAATEADDEDEDVKVVEAAAAPADKPAATPGEKPAATTTTPEDTITVEEIVIEIDE